jgi:hypothetical protein
VAGLTSATAVVVRQPGCAVVARVAFEIFSLAAAPCLSSRHPRRRHACRYRRPCRRLP